MFEDQADKIDWYRQNVGRATHALFHSTGNQRLAIVATELAVLAALDLRTGSVSWRQVLPEGESIAALQQNGRALLSLSTAPAGTYVRLWSLQGALLWDALVPAKEGAAGRPDAVFAASSVVVAWADSVTAFESSSGDVVWRWHATSAQGAPQLGALQLLPAAAEGGEAQLQAVGVVPGGLLRATLSPKDGRVVGEQTLRAAVDTAAALAATSDQSAVAALSGLTLHTLGTGGGAVASASLQALLPQLPGLEAAELLPLPLPGALALRLRARGGGAALALLRVSAGAASLLELLPGEHTPALASSREGKALLALATARADGLSMRVLALEPAGGVGEWSEAELLPYDADAHGPLDAAWLNSYARKDGTLGHRLLLSSADAALQLVQAAKDGGRAAWLREEALAGVRGGLLLPMPALVAEAPGGGAPSFAFALPGLLEGLQRRWSESAAVGGGGAADEPAPRYADAYGTRQVAVLRTAHKIFGLHSSSGELLWSLRVPPRAPGAPPPEVKQLFRADGASKVWAVVQDGDAGWRVLTVAATSGALLDSAEERGAVVHATKVALPDGGGAALLVLSPAVAGDGAIGVYLHPDTPAARRAVRARLAEHHFWLLRASADAPALQGYGLGLNNPDADEKAFELWSPPFQALPRWSLALPAGAAVSSAAFPPDAQAGSPVRVLGDRSVLHKYINRNLLAVGLATAASAEEPYVQVLLVDTVSGGVVHAARHSGCSAPLHMVAGEHWLTYHYWCEGQLHFQVTATELYSNSTSVDDPLALLVGGPVDYTDAANKFDSFSPAAARPHVLSQSYGYPTGLAAMGVTQTAAGLTPRSLLLATSAGQIVALDKKMVDPRRPLVHPQKMTQQQKEEGLIPYMPSLGGVNPLSVTSHRHTVARPTRILTAPTTLESSSLALSIGLDLFLTRVSPAREFDRLNEDFNFFALIGATLFLTVATLGSGWYSKRRDLLAAWR